MTRQKLISSSLAGATLAMLLGIALLAQDNPPPAPSENIDLTGLPGSRGVYVRAAGRWLGLTPNVLMPFERGRSVALEILNVGSDHAIAEIRGAHSGIQIGNDTRPTFYLHGIDATDLYLVRAETKEGNRELYMPTSRHFHEWAHYRAKDLTDVDILGVDGDVVAVKPRTDLKPGEYAFASATQSGERWLRLGFDFGIAGVTSAK
jgi:hypothetical protein